METNKQWGELRVRHPSPEEIIENVKKVLATDLAPYYELQRENIARVYELLRLARISEPRIQGELLRLMVVMSHATLEDVLRTIGHTFLALAGEDVVNDVPLCGLGNQNRPAKFFLGKLVKHKGRTVDEVQNTSSKI